MQQKIILKSATVNSVYLLLDEKLYYFLLKALLSIVTMADGEITSGGGKSPVNFLTLSFFFFYLIANIAPCNC